MVCYMKKGGVAVADWDTILLALPFVSLVTNDEVPSVVSQVVSQVESVTHILA